MKKLIALGAVLLMTLVMASPAGCYWLDNSHWVDETLVIEFRGTKAAVWQLLPSFGGYMCLEEWTSKEAYEYIEYWYYMHSA